MKFLVVCTAIEVTGLAEAVDRPAARRRYWEKDFISEYLGPTNEAEEYHQNSLKIK
jgi:hypothetical protein